VRAGPNRAQEPSEFSPNASPLIAAKPFGLQCYAIPPYAGLFYCEIMGL
jgi:hypothetical protein